jgi:CBS domain-containing protein
LIRKSNTVYWTPFRRLCREEETVKIKQVMTPRKDLATVTTTATLSEVARSMMESDTGIIPVLDNQDHLLGVITDRDITVRGVARGANLAATRVGDYMSTAVKTIKPDDDLDEASRMMATQQLHRLPAQPRGHGQRHRR